MSGKGARRRYLESKGFIKPKTTVLSRSEGGRRYQYDTRIANRFAHWSTAQRDAGKVPMFGEFYNELPPDDQQQITITQIFTNNETEKAN